MTTRKEKGPQKVPLMNCGKPRESQHLKSLPDGTVVCDPGILNMSPDQPLTFVACHAYRRLACHNICVWKLDGSVTPDAAHLPPDFTPKPK